MKKLLIIAPLIVVIGVAATSKLIDVHNDLAAQRDAVARQWAQVDEALRSRADLIPSLVQAVQGFDRRETAVFESISGARAALIGGRTPQEKVQANDQLSAALARLLLAAENYPRLRSNVNFLHLQDDISTAENNIAIERRKYNEILEHYNAQIQRFPDNAVASMSGFKRNDAYFQTDGANRAGPTVKF